MVFTILNQDDPIGRALNALSGQAANMDASRQTITSIMGDVQASIKCTAADIFQARMDDWLVRQQVIRDSWERLFEALGAAEAAIQAGHEQAIQVAGGS